jgi:DNA-binding MarR family transcriptional regulator
MARARRRTEPLAIEQDPYLLLVACTAAGAERVERRIAAHGFPALRESHGYLIQHLVPGPKTIGQLATLLGMTQQGASKCVTELESAGYVARRSDERDARVRAVALTDHGWAVVHATRIARRELRDALRSRLGAARYEQFRAALVEVATWSGGLTRLTGRALSPGG